jgi:hypothetical protein
VPGCAILIEAFTIAPGGPFTRVMLVDEGAIIPAKDVPHEIGLLLKTVKLPVPSIKAAVE